MRLAAAIALHGYAAQRSPRTARTRPAPRESHRVGCLEASDRQRSADRRGSSRPGFPCRLTATGVRFLARACRQSLQQQQQQVGVPGEPHPARIHVQRARPVLQDVPGNGAVEGLAGAANWLEARRCPLTALPQPCRIWQPRAVAGAYRKHAASLSAQTGPDRSAVSRRRARRVNVPPCIVAASLSIDNLSHPTGMNRTIDWRRIRFPERYFPFAPTTLL
jgi:hypothetical protein